MSLVGSTDTFEFKTPSHLKKPWSLGVPRQVGALPWLKAAVIRFGKEWAVRFDVIGFNSNYQESLNYKVFDRKSFFISHQEIVPDISGCSWLRMSIKNKTEFNTTNLQ
ncbi:MAG TPA: hypothetical protein PLB18_05140 [Acidobacteriota bacterium]|nr:hypothetical protein [Acidobacteriota bacterium]